MKTSKRLLSILLMLTMLVSMFTVMASAVATDGPSVDDCLLERVAEVPATCTTPGVKEYYHCSISGRDNFDKFYLLNGTGAITEVTKSDLEIPATGHTLKVVEAKAPTCTKTGNPKYYQCASCGKDFANATDTEPTAKPMVATAKTINATGHKPGKVVEAQAGNCVKIGNVEYTQCTECEEYLTKNAKGEWVETDYDAIRTRGDHNLEKVEAKAATCTEDGNPVYYRCKVCGKDFKDAEGKNKINGTEKIIPALGHELEHVAAKEPTKTATGNIEYWRCKRCNKYFSDADGKNEITEASTVVEKIVEHVLCFDIQKNVTLKRANLTVDNKREYQLKKGDSFSFTATAAKGCKVVWQIDDGAKHYEGSTAEINVSFEALNTNSTLHVWAVKSSDELDLDLDVSGISHGKLWFKEKGDTNWTKLTKDKTFTLSEGGYVEFETDPDTGYKTVWQFEDESKKTRDTFKVTYSMLDGEDCTLSMSFVRKSSSDTDDYPTLTFDITGAKHGKVYRGTREYEDGDVISIKKNDKMTFKATADKGYVAVWTYKGDTYVGDEYTVKMGSTDAKLYVEFMDKDDIRLTELPFRDVSKRDWYYDDVVYVYRKGYMDGMSSTRFGGELNTTRGQIVTILWRLTGEPRATRNNPFSDVSSRQYYYDAISWAYDAGVVDGFDAHTFKPDQNVTREQLAAILYRYAEYMNLSTSGSAYLAKYRDADKIASWAYDAMAWANYHGLINGTSATRIDPKGYATRAQIAAILHRFAVEFGA